jgi:hypothetical protein
MKYELWREMEGETVVSCTLFPSDNESVRNSLEPDAELLCTIWVDSWEEAKELRDKILGH